jgi:Protein of unknown function (DUF4031)/Protein of unknown function, DUF488
VIYVDRLFGCQKSAQWPYTQACHLMADSLDELHVFASKLGLRRNWYQAHDKLGHYDLTPGMRARAIKLGAQEISALDEYRRLWTKPVERKVYPVGYSAFGSEQLIDQLMNDPSMLLIDTRYKPYSWRPEWRSEALRAKWGKRYRVAGSSLGNTAYNARTRIGDKPYPVEIKIANLATGIRGLQMYLAEGHDLILLCQCADYSVCHRKVIVDALKVASPEVEVVLPGVAAEGV